MRSRGKPRAALQQRRWRTCHDLHHTAKTLGLTGPHALSAAPTKGSSRSSPMSAIGPKRTSIGPGHCTVDWQRNGREEYVIGIIMPLGVDEPFGIGTVGLHRAIVTRSEKVRIGTGKVLSSRLWPAPWAAYDTKGRKITGNEAEAEWVR